jgi:low affinity Fe/Cu permease
MDRIFSSISSRMATWAGQPLTFILAVMIIVIWVVSGPVFGWSDTWQLVINTGTTIVTFLMVFLIQNAQNEYIGIEHLTDDEIGRIRAALEAKELGNGRGHGLGQLIERR